MTRDSRVLENSFSFAHPLYRQNNKRIQRKPLYRVRILDSVHREQLPLSVLTATKNSSAPFLPNKTNPSSQSPSTPSTTSPHPPGQGAPLVPPLAVGHVRVPLGPASFLGHLDHAVSVALAGRRLRRLGHAVVLFEVAMDLVQPLQDADELGARGALAQGGVGERAVVVRCPMVV